MIHFALRFGTILGDALVQALEEELECRIKDMQLTRQAASNNLQAACRTWQEALGAGRSALEYFVRNVFRAENETGTSLATKTTSHIQRMMKATNETIWDGTVGYARNRELDSW